MLIVRPNPEEARLLGKQKKGYLDTDDAEDTNIGKTPDCPIETKAHFSTTRSMVPTDRSESKTREVNRRSGVLICACNLRDSRYFMGFQQFSRECFPLA